MQRAERDGSEPNRAIRRGWRSSAPLYVVAALMTSSCALIFQYDDYKGQSGLGGSDGTGIGGSTSSGAGAGPCMCPPPPNTACATYDCASGECVRTFAPLGQSAPGDPPGPCKANVCNGSGEIVVGIDNTKLPNDSNDCTDDACVDGVGQNTNRPDGSPCGATGTLACKGGHCSGCAANADCAATGDPCLDPLCMNPGVSGVCGTQPRPDGTFVANEFPDDCKKTQCVSGVATLTPDDSETPQVDPDPNNCKKRVCTGGMATLVADDSETPQPDLDPSNCKKMACAGGMPTLVADDSETPAPDGNACDGAVCVGGSPTHPYLGDGAMCGGGKQCLSGNCYECITNNFAACNVGGPGYCFNHFCQHCNTQGDCSNAGGGCCNPATHACSGNPSCSDGCQDGAESAGACGISGVDCGTASCGACNNCSCGSNADCHTHTCSPTFGSICARCDAPGVGVVCTGTCDPVSGVCN